MKMNRYQLELGGLLILAGLLIINNKEAWTGQTTAGFLVAIVGAALVYLKLAKKFGLWPLNY